MKIDIEKWLKEDSEKFLKDVGIKKGQIVLDFGCGVGHYTIPAAKVVGEKGKVYAIDEDGEALSELMKIAKSKGLKNIEPIETSGELKIPIEDESIDVVLLYDVLHSYYLGVGERKKLLEEVYRVSKTDALISVYPKHMELENTVRELERANFRLERKSFKSLVHDDNYDKGHILNFRKKGNLQP